MSFSTFRKYFIYSLFFFPSLIFCVDYTKNPYVIQGVVLWIVVALIWSTWLIESIRNGKITFKKLNIVDISLICFFLICLISWGIAFIKFPESSNALFGEGRRRMLLFLMNGILVYFLTRYFVSDNKYFNKVVSFLFFAAFISSFYGIMQYLGIELIWTRNMTPFGTRCVTTFGNPNFFSSYLILIIPLATHRVIYNNNFVNRMLWLALDFFLIIGLICTGTRSSWAALIIIVLIIIMTHLKMFVYEFKHIWKKLLVISLILISILVFSPIKKSMVDRFNDTFDKSYKNQGLYQRIMVWSAARDMFFDNPFIGVGWGMLEMFYPYYQAKYIDQDKYKTYRTHANNAHNELLELLAQVGLIGTGIFIWFMFCFFKFTKPSLMKHDRTARDSIFIIAGIIAMLVDNMLNVSMHFAIPMLVFWFLMGVMVNKAEWSSNTYSIYKEIKLNYFIKILLFLIILFFAIICMHKVRRFRAHVYHFKGLDAIKGGKRINTFYLNKAVTNLKKSYELNKYSVNNNYELGNAYSRQKIMDKARWAYSEAIKYMPGYDEIYYNLGVMYFNNNEVSDALKYFNISYSINPRSKEVLTILGHIYIKNEKYYDKAIHVLGKLKELKYADHIAYNNLGYLYSVNKDWDKAVANYKLAYELNPSLGSIKENILRANRKEIGVPIIIYNFVVKFDDKQSGK